jgi:hypothetical protein
MTSAHARTAANVVLVSAGVAAAIVVYTTPPLRRLAVRWLRAGAGLAIPYLVREIREAWAQSARAA